MFLMIMKNWVNCSNLQKKVVRSSHQRCSMKNMLLKISKNSQENNCARVSFLMKDNFIEKEAVAQMLPMSFEKFLRTPFLQNTSCFCKVRFEKCISKSVRFGISISVDDEALLIDECLIINLDLHFFKFDI